MASIPASRFLNLPTSIRQTIYTYLLAPSQDESVTTLNYTLEWPWLENPSNTTFAGPTQLDLCRCPQRTIRTHNTQTEDHIYVRHKCHPPEVRFKSVREGLWLLQEPYGQFNLLRPATQLEIERQPSLSILLVNRQIYTEALPILYRGRNFLFLTGPCPRGRYQAFATKRWLETRHTAIKNGITSISLLIQSYEEDCNNNNAGGAYAELSQYIMENVPNLQILCLNFWDGGLADASREFCILFQRPGMRIMLSENWRVPTWQEFTDPVSFLFALKQSHERGARNTADKIALQETSEGNARRGKDGERRKASEERRREKKSHGARSRRDKNIIFEEVGFDNAENLQVEEAYLKGIIKKDLVNNKKMDKGKGPAQKMRHRVSQAHGDDVDDVDRKKRQEELENTVSALHTDEAYEPELFQRNRSLGRISKSIGRGGGKGKGKEKAPVEERSDDEWVDATLSPTSPDVRQGKEYEGWEVL